MEASMPLPPNPFPESAFQVAYQRCLDLEAAAPSLKTSSLCPPPLVCARLLGHLLRLAPNSNSRGQIQQDITAAKDHGQLMEVAGVYFHGFTRTFMRSSGPTPAPSEHPSRPSFEDVRAYSMDSKEEGKLDPRKARSAALLRDNYKCIITGETDIKHGGAVYCQASHIIPEATNMKIEEDVGKRRHSAAVWSILSMFTDINIIVDLAGDKIHRLENIMTLSETCHHLFDDLYLWLKPIEGSLHTYSVHVHRELFRQKHSIPETVTFSTTTDLPLPQAAFLALHALCCEIAWMSGAAEHIMDMERRKDEASILANDGSNADLLANALALVSDHQYRDV